MLTLDTKKIRKGKAIGLPYQGSKKKIAKQIVEIIKQNFGVDKPIYDIFGGGGAITAECLINNLTVYYNDTNKMILDCFIKVINSDFDYFKTLICSRDEFNKIYQKEYYTIDDYLKLMINSFGNNRKNYLYNKEIADTKYQLAKKIIERHGLFGGYKNTETYKKELLLIGKNGLQNDDTKLQQLEILQQLQHLQQLEQLSRVQQLDDMTFLKNHLPKIISNQSYEYFSNIENAILYLDPPYENSVGYEKCKARHVDSDTYNKIKQELLTMPKHSTIIRDGFKFTLGMESNNKNRMYYKDLQAFNNFNSQQFYDWAVMMSKKNIVLVSSYTISDDRFKCVYEFKKARSTLQGGVSKNKDKFERLFTVRSNYT